MEKRLSVGVLLLTLAMAGCTISVHPHFGSNRYVENYNIHVINDSLRLYLKSPADFDYATSPGSLRKAVRKQRLWRLRNVLLYAKTNLDPFYAYFLTRGEQAPLRRRFTDNSNVLVLDTTLNGQRFVLVSINLDEDRHTYKADMTSIFASLRVGDDYRKDVSTVMDVAREYGHTNRFLQAYQQLKAFPPYDAAEANLKLQMQLTYASLLANFREYDQLLDQFFTGATNDTVRRTLSQHQLSGERGLAALLARADSTPLILFNENHLVPRHRALVTTLLPALRAKGFSYLALEGLGPGQDSVLNQPGSYPTLRSGFYLKEQHFAQLIRTAQALGFRLVAYEDTAGTGDRETAQADNLYRNTFARDPGAKVVALVGISHLLESPTPEGKKWMAAVFKEKYRIDPLSVSQTHLLRYQAAGQSSIALIAGRVFADPRLSVVDFHLLNRLDADATGNRGAGLHYTNKSGFPVQVAVFLAAELGEGDDYEDRVPFRSVYLAPREKRRISLPPELTPCTRLTGRAARSTPGKSRRLTSR
jgi:hypothetical protein